MCAYYRLIVRIFDHLRPALEEIASVIMQETGMSILLMVGGLKPARDGQMAYRTYVWPCLFRLTNISTHYTSRIHNGYTAMGDQTFSEHYLGFDKYVKEPFKAFTRACFSSSKLFILSICIDFNSYLAAPDDIRNSSLVPQVPSPTAGFHGEKSMNFSTGDSYPATSSTTLCVEAKNAINRQVF